MTTALDPLTTSLQHDYFRQTWHMLYNAVKAGKRPSNMSLKQFIDEGRPPVLTVSPGSSLRPPCLSVEPLPTCALCEQRERERERKRERSR